MTRLGLLACLGLLVACGASGTVQYLPIGSPCDSSGQCGTSPYACAKAGYPNGYCQRDCTTDGDCPTDSICSVALHQCRRNCANGCRAAEGYACVDEHGTTMVCDIVAVSDGGT